MPFQLFDTVRLVKESPDLPLTCQSIGTIVEIYLEPALAYEVEFCDENGRTTILQAFKPEELRPA